MATYKSYSQIVKSMVDRLRIVQPGLDTKPGSVSRDLFVDLQADEIQKIYNLISLVSDKQSFATAVGSDLDKIANNFGFSRKRGAPSSGTVIFSVGSLDIDLEIEEGTIVSTRSGVSFRTIGNYSLISSQKNIYSANASRVRKQLNIAGSSSGFAIEIPIEAVNSGESGNIGSYQIVNQSAPFNFSVTNINSISGGSDIESDSEFRRRFLSSFSGSNVGTSSGYLNSILSIDSVLDALVVEPGNTLMLRDGTETIEGDLGASRIVRSGSGGKVDIYVLGKRLQEVSESFIFFNKSTSGNLSDPINDYILGNFNQNVSLTSKERKVYALREGNVPFQPVSSIISVTGSESGLLAEGETFELLKDSNYDTGGSPFGFDKIRFMSNYKNVVAENMLKGKFGSSDGLRYGDSLENVELYQDIGIEDENSSVNQSDRRFIILNHKNITNVSLVQNETAGEIYTIENLFLEDSINEEGVVEISGKRLPAVTDNLKVSYSWRKYYDKNLDFLPASSSISWRHSFKKEDRFLLTDGEKYSIGMTDAILDIINVYIYEEETATVEITGTTKYLDLSRQILNAKSIKIGGIDILNTERSDHSFEGVRLFLPTDSGAFVGESCSVVYNYEEVYSFDGVKGSFQGSTLTLPEEILFDAARYERLNTFFVENKNPIVDYYPLCEKMIPSVSIGRLPVYSFPESDRFIDSSQSDISESYKPSEYNSEFKRYSPSRVRIFAESITNYGEVKVSGTTLLRKVISIELSRIFNGNVFDLSSYKYGNGIAKISSVYVNKKANMSGYRIASNRYSNDALVDPSLGAYQFYLSSSSDNIFSYSDGDIAEIEVYFYQTSDSEILHFYEDSFRETEKVFLEVKSISRYSGFSISNLVSGSISVEFGNSPEGLSQYLCDYRFAAPKDGERIFVTYNHNSIISDATVGVESSRAITADVLVKEAAEIMVDVQATIVVSENFTDESETIKENAIDQVANLLSTNVLGGTIDYSDIMRAITNVTGVESADVGLFNIIGSIGRRNYIKALDNQSISPNLIDISVVTRKDFRIS